MTMLVTGGTGLLGRSVVSRLAADGHPVRVLSRDPAAATAVPDGVELRRGDLRDPASLRAAVSSVDTVVHCASDVRSTQDVDVAGTANLLGAMRALDVGHLVYVSIVGVDRIPLKLYRAKHDAERAIEAQDVPWTIQRATQFHPFVETVLSASARLPVLLCPSGVRLQPIDVAEVADRLVGHVDAGPAGRAPDLGGPEVLDYRELAATWLAAVGRRRPQLTVPLPGGVGRGFRAGANLCPQQASGGPTWQQYLQEVHGAADVGR